MIRLSLLLIALSLLVSCQKETETQRRSDYGVHGIDVSHYQSTIDWKQIGEATAADKRIDFAYVKATEGESYRDSFFLRNWVAIDTLTDIKRGAYHFFRPSVSAQKQVKNFTSFVELKSGDLPPVLDFEVTGDLNPEQLRKSLKQWLFAVELYYGVRPLIYTNLNLYHQYIKHHFDDYKIWIARYNSTKPDLDIEATEGWHFWQYGNRGKLEGVKGDVDFNVFYGDINEFESLFAMDKDTSKPSIIDLP